MKRFISWAVSFALAALIVAVPLAAQSRSADARASTLVIANLTLVKTQDMTLGSPSGNFAAAGFVTSSDVGAQPAQWNGSTDPGNNLQAQFTTLPSVLTGPGGSTVPFHCGTASGIISGGSGGGFFNPNLAGISGPISSSGNFVVILGANGSPGPNDNNCDANLSGAHAGVYSATITLTITVL